MPYSLASQLLAVLNSPAYGKKKRDLETKDFGFTSLGGEACTGPDLAHAYEGLKPRTTPLTRGIHRRQSQALTPGYVTTGKPSFSLATVVEDSLIYSIDDFGTDGDDTPHSKIPSYDQPNAIQANASFPANGLPSSVDLVFLDYIAPTDVLPALQSLGAKYTINDVSYYLPKTFTTNSYLPAYAKIAWQANVPNCPVGQGVGYPT